MSKNLKVNNNKGNMKAIKKRIQKRMTNGLHKRFRVSIDAAARSLTLNDEATGYSYQFALNGGFDDALVPNEEFRGRLMMPVDLADRAVKPAIVNNGEYLLVGRSK